MTDFEIALPRCCFDTFKRDAPREPTDGVELPCDHCMAVIRFNGTEWKLWTGWTLDTPTRIES